MSDLFKTPIFPSKPYEKQESKSFLRACQNGKYNEVKELLQQDRYMVYQFDEVE